MARSPPSAWLAAMPAMTVGFLQIASAEEAEPAPGTLYLSNAILADAATGTRQYSLRLDPPTEEAFQKAYVAFSTLATTQATLFTFEVESETTLSGPINVNLFFSQDSYSTHRPGYSGVVASSQLDLLKGTTVIGSAFTYDQLGTYAPSIIVHQRNYTIDGKETKFAPGERLGVRLYLWVDSPPEAVTKAVYVLVNSTKFTSRVTGLGVPGAAPALPAPPVAPVTWTNVSGPELVVNEAFDLATTQAQHYNWTTDAAAVASSHDVGAKNGTATIRVWEPDGAEAFNASFTNESVEAAGESRTLPGGPGNWTMEVGYREFVGSLRFSLAPRTAPGSDANATASGDRSGGAASAEGGVPALGLVGTLAAAWVGAAMWSRTRRP